MKFDEVLLSVAKLAGIVVVSKELARLSTPPAVALIQNDMIAQCAKMVDEAFFSAAAATVDSPAGILEGATEVVSSGASAADVASDLTEMLGALTCDLTKVAIVMRPSAALHISALLNAAGTAAFPGASVAGGSIWGLPLFISPAAADRIIAIDASAVMLADDGAQFDPSENATVVMDSAPAVGVAAIVNFFQNNLFGIRVDRFINWQLAQAGCCAFVSGISY